MNRHSAARCCLLGLVLACATAATAATAAQTAFAPTAPPLEPGAQALRPHFELQIEAPAPLDAFLLRHAELQRLRHLPDLSRPELE
ncbi:MAG: outer membrane protein assembly factor, partial [Serpentinimonas sp.]|nr:outer membrane protein assembly factor [Serpentinimonas sp.]